jgi:hypothetical protein
MGNGMAYAENSIIRCIIDALNAGGLKTFERGNIVNVT